MIWNYRGLIGQARDSSLKNIIYIILNLKNILKRGI